VTHPPEKIAKLKQCLLDESVYNMLSIHGNNTVRMVAECLCAVWNPRWQPSHEVVTVQSVGESAKRLRDMELIVIDGEKLGIPVRDPKTRKGRAVRTDYQNACLVWRGKGL
jgi:hypothetical protein